MATLAEKIIAFYSDLEYEGQLPDGISIMNPIKENEKAFLAASAFYRKYYNDNRPRRMILGINPGRNGAGATGIPFTDTIRLKEVCGIELPGMKTYETSSVFIYEMIEKYGGPDSFYSDYFISSVSPLGFTKKGLNGKELNYNYYDSRELTAAIIDFAINSLEIQLNFGFDRKKAFCLGTGKNFSFLSKLNSKYNFFGEIIALEHPRFIMQYRAKRKEEFIINYFNNLKTDFE